MKKVIIISLSILIIISVIIFAGLHFLGNRVLSEIIDSEMANTSQNLASNGDDTGTSELSPDQLNELKASISESDKVRVAAILVKRMSMEEINELKGMVSGGISPAEKSKAKTIIKSNLNDEEIQEIQEMYKKYVNEQN